MSTDRVLQVLPSNNNQQIKTRANEQNLQKTLSKTFIIAQIFGCLPVQGVTGPDWRSLHFKWTSLRVLYTISILIGASFLTIIQAITNARKEITIFDINRFIKSLLAVVFGLLNLKFAKNWPKLMKHWYFVDKSMENYGYPKNLNRKINTILTVFMGLALFDLILRKIYSLIVALNCGSNSGVLTYFLRNTTLVDDYSIIDYNIIYGIFLQFLHLHIICYWSFADVFLMILSLCLSERFVQINKRLEANLHGNLEFWKAIRVDHNRLSNLCRLVNTEIADFVIYAFATDLFSLLIRIFNFIFPVAHSFGRICYCYAFVSIIIRIICLCIIGANISEENKRSLQILNGVSSTVYNDEIERFINQITYCDVGITGRNFFSVTRTLLVSIAGAIVSYELVLIQFNYSFIEQVIQRNRTC